MVRRIADLEVGELGLGCMGLATVYGRPDPREARATLDAALEGGVRLLDTADMYGDGTSERFLGEWLPGRRDRVVLATKAGIRTRLGGLPAGLDGRPAHLRAALDASLGRLGTDHVDLYYLHRVDPRVPIEDSVGAIAGFVQAGKVRQVGVSEVTASELLRAHSVHPIAAVQSEWSLFTRDLERDVVPAARSIGATVVPYSPLGRGMLTGDPRATTRLPLLDYRRFLPRWRGANLRRNLALVDRVREVAGRIGATPAQVALAWLLGQGEDVVPIPGTTRRRSLADNLGATRITLTDGDRAALDGLQAAGGRYGRRGAMGVLPEDAAG
ncbi:aldo/keto reductase [uncultured Amnibacterium sp.]|uniref:aldo/keto reductase n=1 Tax=uncultured Amnibacterium sp. TaxID=1631851 RepID=UPI0035CC5821